MRVVLIDDERLALQFLRKKLEVDIGGVEVVGMFTDPADALAKGAALRPDAIFLDIQMPEINGLQLGSKLQELGLAAEIVFVTGYDRYAVQAFELYALDYVMKPVETARLRNTVQRLERLLGMSGEQRRQPQADHEACLIGCFNRISFQLPGGQPQYAKWRTSKAQELFAYLLHQRGIPVERETLFELLWPDFDRARAAQQLYTTIYHIRQTLKQIGVRSVAISSSGLDTGYVLELGRTRLDIQEWEDGVKALGEPDGSRLGDYERMLDAYKGDYLGHLEYVWAEHERERLRRLWLQRAEKLALHYRDNGMLREEIGLRQRIQQMFPYEEEHYFLLMKLYDTLGEEVHVKEQYRQLAAMAHSELEGPVSEEIEQWYALWLRSKTGRGTLLPAPRGEGKGSRVRQAAGAARWNIIK